MANVSTSFGFDDVKYMVEPVSTWTTEQMVLFPFLFVVPAEIFGWFVNFLIWAIPSTLPGPKWEDREPLAWSPDLYYIYFNRFFMLPFISWLIVRTVWNSEAVVYDMDQINVWNFLVSGVICFALSDFVYYAGHRIVHKFPLVYGYVHKHHHQEAQPIRGWADTCNAHPSDFFYTAWSTSPMSTLWLFPAGSIHIAAILACMWVNAFVGALGHCRLDLNVGIFNTRFHAGHHGRSSCNFAQNIELWDRLFGTYQELNMDGGIIPKSPKATKAQ